MAEPPEISCVVPTFESVDLAAACLASIRAQKDVRAEVIVTDDSPTGTLRERLDVATGDAILWLEGPRTGNPVDNWNCGLDHCRTPLRVVIHQDEALIDPYYLRDAAARLKDPRLAVVIGRTKVHGGARRSRHEAVAAVGRRLPAAPRWLPLINWIGPTAAFVFRGEHRFDRSLVQLVDIEFYSRVLRTGRYTILAGDHVASRGYHDDQITASIDPVVVALRELEVLSLPPVILTAARLATRARRWTR